MAVCKKFYVRGGFIERKIMSGIEEFLADYVPWDECERAYKESFVQFWQAVGDKIYERGCLPGHISVSAFVTNQAHNKVLMAYHKILDRWAWLGGHADGECELLPVAIREVREESSLCDVRPARAEPVSLEVLWVPEHVKRGQFVSAHLHYNVTYWLEADEEEPLHNKPDENTAVKWIGFDEISDYVQDEVDNKIYRRIIKKIQSMKG